MIYINTSLKVRYAGLPASPAALLGRFAPPRLASRMLCSRAFCALRSRKFSQRSVSQSTLNALNCVKMQKKITPLTCSALRNITLDNFNVHDLVIRSTSYVKGHRRGGVCVL